MHTSLRILGPAELTGETGAAILSVLKQPKRMAFLAYLAVAPDGRCTRAEAVDLFWGDQEEEKARHALSQALYYLRRSLGKEAVLADGESLRLNPEVVESDVAAFRGHLGGGRLEPAVALYRGELLQGFPHTGIGGFERWLDGAREGLRRQAVEALEQLSSEAQERGDPLQAIHWAERACVVAPYHETPVRRLITALMAASEPVRAREAYDRFAGLIRAELELEPSPDTTALLERSLPEPKHPLATPEDALDEGDGSLRASSDAADGPSRPPEPPVRQWRGLRRIAITMAAAALVVVVARMAYTDGSSMPVVDASAGRIGIFPFLYRGHADLAYLGDGIPELISISIRGLDRVSTLDPRALVSRSDTDLTEPRSTMDVAERARALGAGHFVVGSVVEAGGQIQVTARLHRIDGELVATVSERAATEDALFELVDDLVRQLVASEAFPGPSDLERAAALTTGSLPALRHFLRGEFHFREGRFPDAARAFDAAVEQDSAFALALYRGAAASIWSNEADFDAARRRVARALRHRDRVSSLEADLFLALDEFLHGRLLPAERLYQSVLARQPENIEAWFQLGEVRFHYGALHGRGAQEAGSAWERALALNTDHRPALIHMAALAALRGDPVLDSLERRVNAGDEAPVSAPQIRALRVFSAGPAADRRRFLDELGRHRARDIAGTAAYASRYLRDPAIGARVARLLTRSARPERERAQGHLLLAHFEVASGRPAAANVELRRAESLDPGAAYIHRLLLATLPVAAIELRGHGGTVDAMPRVDLEGELGGPVSFDGGMESGLEVYGRALAYHRAGGEEGALLSDARLLSEATGSAGDSSVLRPLGRGLMAERYLSQGDSASAGRELEGAVQGVERWYEHLRKSHLISLARERFLLAETDIGQGSVERAEGLLLALGDNAVAELPYLVPALVRVGELRERAGDTSGALAAYEKALALWSDAEPTLAPVVDELRARVAALGGGHEGRKRPAGQLYR